jgi:hypothetical protein
VTDNSNDVPVDVSNLPDVAEVVCAEESDNAICERQVGVVKETEVGAMFIPDQGPIFYVGKWKLPHAPNEPAPRARCPIHGWVTADEAHLLSALEKPGTPRVRAYALGLR